MHRSSDTIGNISGALAKAQAELTNPEKSLTGDHPLALPTGAGSHLPLCPAVERARHRVWPWEGAGKAAQPQTNNFPWGPRSSLALTWSAPWGKWFACATRTTADSYCGKPASSAAVCHRTHITLPLHSHTRSGAERAMSSSSRSVGFTIASFTAQRTKPHGGAASTSIRFQSRSSSASRHGAMANCPA